MLSSCKKMETKAEAFRKGVEDGTENITTVTPGCTGYCMHLWSLPQTMNKSSNGDWDNHCGMTSI